MGTVYLAYDLQSQRRVALKLLLGGGDLPLERFQREGEIAAQLRHPGIVRVFSSGRAGGRPWLSYELVEDARSLSAACEERDLRGQIELIAQAAEALEHAHARGVVHRDVKPDNVLVDTTGQVRVTDFGLALGLESERLTQTGTIVGTPHYMAPEQIRAAKETLGPPVDVWALGVILYQRLTGVLPFQGATLYELVRRINDAKCDPPGAVAEVPGPLAQICERALLAKAGERYASAGLMAADLRRWLAGRELCAAKGGGARRLAGWSAGVSLLVAFGVGLGLWILERARPVTLAASQTAAPATSARPQTPAEVLASLRARPPFARLAGLRALLQDVGPGPVRTETEQSLSRLGERPLQILTDPESVEHPHSFVTLGFGGEVLTSTRFAKRWRLGEALPLEVLPKTTGRGLACGGRLFLGAIGGKLLELEGPTLAEAREHSLGSAQISRLGADARAELLVVAHDSLLSARRRRPDGSYGPPEFELECGFEISGVCVDPAGAWIAVCGGERFDLPTSDIFGSVWVLRPSGEVLWKRTLPPRPEAIALAQGALYVGTTTGRLLAFSLEGEPLPELFAPAGTTNFGSGVSFRRPFAHGTLIHAIAPTAPGRILSVSGGPTAKGNLSELRLWELGSPTPHRGCLLIKGLFGVSLAVDQARGLILLGTRQGLILVWSMEAVLAQRTYTVEANGTGR